jgi:hypothetical protein
MALGVADREVIDRVSCLADTYAEQIADALPEVDSEETLRRGLAGTLMSFLADALVVANLARAVE